MKTAKLELNSFDAANLYRALAALKRELKAEGEAEPENRAAIAASIASVDQLQNTVAIIFEKTRPNPQRKVKV